MLGIVLNIYKFIVVFILYICIYIYLYVYVLYIIYEDILLTEYMAYKNINIYIYNSIFINLKYKLNVNCKLLT